METINNDQSIDAGNIDVIILGMKNFQSELLASFFQAELCTEKVCVLENTATATQSFNRTPKNSLILCECQSLKRNGAPLEINEFMKNCATENSLVLFNAPIDNKIERDALETGFKGVFYDNDSLSIFKKGINAILQGELWYSRRTLSQSFEETKKALKTNPPNSLLTPREKEILGLIADGTENQQIAKKLKISAHTVKTHVYNIYSKLNVPNRIQAVLWAAKHL